MKAYRLALLRKEFPFLDQLFESRDPELWRVNDIQIRRGDQTLLNKKGSEDSYSWSGGGHYDYSIYFAVYQDGEETKIRRLETEGCSGTGSGDREEWDCDTNGEQLYAMGITPDWIVECEKADHDDNGNGYQRFTWTIYKMQRFDLCAYHQQQLDRAAAELKAEIAASCLAA